LVPGLRKWRSCMSGKMIPETALCISEAAYLAQLGNHLDGCLIEMKNTFLHFNFGCNLERGMCLPFRHHRHCQSAPLVLMHQSFDTKSAGMELTHSRKKCTPCAYYHHKVDGCRLGDACQFCHICPPGQLKIWKKEQKMWRRNMKRAAPHSEDCAHDATMSPNSQHGDASSRFADYASTTGRA